MIFPYISTTPGELIFQCVDWVNADILLWLSLGAWWPLDGLVKLSFQTLNLRAGLLACGEKKKISHGVFTGKGGLATGCHLISLGHVYAEIWVGNGKYAANLYHVIAVRGCSVVIIHGRRDNLSSQGVLCESHIRLLSYSIISVRYPLKRMLLTAKTILP